MLFRAVHLRACELVFLADIDTTVSLDAYVFVEGSLNRH